MKQNLNKYLVLDLLISGLIELILLVVIACIPFFHYLGPTPKPSIYGFIALIWGGWFAFGFAIIQMVAVYYQRVTLARVLGLLVITSLIVNIVASFLILEALGGETASVYINVPSFSMLILVLLDSFFNSIALFSYMFLQKRKTTDTQKTEAIKDLYCKACGFQIQEEFTYCPNCNTQISEMQA